MLPSITLKIFGREIMKGTHEIIEKSTLWLFEVMLLKKGIVTCKATPLESIRIEWQLKKFLVPFPNYMKWNFQGSLH
ncbi:hypothetical protein JHK82_049745 [Glycine max]|nr:hypothetical protein JHK86_049617 [Glycine max]KAG4923869.1 hypothetical protein JHK87_049409 [Glycine soja]KAG4935443.1 hypothetical protein JHK85_050362 [Glycine max]KAG5090967.1 hypothetical protein JHK82_049745 [Glycine max]KAG5094059.1 hypothetical protein JHK84_049647 [Glycine max]